MDFTILNAICWGVSGLVWIFGGVYNSFKSPEKKKKRAPYDWILLTIFVGVGMHFIPDKYLNYALFHLVWLQIVGVILLIISTCFTLWSRWVLGEMWATDAAVKNEHQLVTSGPYRITRHPIYTGILGMILGSLFSLSQSIMFFLVFFIVLIFFINRMNNEEQLMVMTFGEQYIQYKNRVPRLIPGLKRKMRK